MNQTAARQDVWLNMSKTHRFGLRTVIEEVFPHSQGECCLVQLLKHKKKEKNQSNKTNKQWKHGIDIWNGCVAY